MTTELTTTARSGWARRGVRLAPHPDRLLPPDPGVRAIARRLYGEVRDLPVVSPHGHVDPRLLLDDAPFSDAASLLVTPDHYVKRLLHASGVPLEGLGVDADDGPDGQDDGPLGEARARQAWRALSEHWGALAGTPVRSWLETTLAEVLDVGEHPSAANADALFDHVGAVLQEPRMRPRALYETFRITVLATTDDPADDLAAHAALAADPGFAGRVVPTFRPDRYLEPASPGWAGAVRRLGEVAGVDTGDYAGYLSALEARRRTFVEHGATSADHSHADLGTEPLEPAEAAAVYAAALRGEVSPRAATAFRRHMVLEMARMSVEDGLVMTLHPGILRGHHGPTAARFGPDQGHDIPTSLELTRALKPLLERFGTAAGFHLVVFTVDETVLSRELAPLAGFYPAVHIGAPWWFLDAPHAIRRWREAVTETAGFTRGSGFIDDTRAFCSIPARHDTARRLDSGYLAQLVAEHRMEEDEAADIGRSLVVDQPVRVFKL